MSATMMETIKMNLINRLQEAEDVVYKNLHTKEKYLEVLYIKTISDESVFYDKLIKPFFEIETPAQFLTYLQSNPQIKTFESESQTLDELLHGVAILFYQENIFLFDNKVDHNKQVLDTTVETTVQGPQSGFSESLPVNLGLIRQRYPSAELSVESMSVGTISKTKVMVLHDRKFADPDTLSRIKQFLSSIDVQMFQTGEQLLDIIKKSNRALLPVMLVTERPDRVAVNLATGKIIVLVHGSPFAVILPTVMKDFMSSMEDIYETYWIVNCLRVLRYLGFVVSIVLPGLYVAVTSYN